MTLKVDRTTQTSKCYETPTLTRLGCVSRQPSVPHIKCPATTRHKRFLHRALFAIQDLESLRQLPES